MNSMADILAKAGVVTLDQAAVAKKLKHDIEEVKSDLRVYRRMKGGTEEQRKMLPVLEARLAILERTRVAR